VSTPADTIQLHEQLRDLLQSAHAESCQVVATFLDIRGFSSFAAKGESFDAALYLRAVYEKILSAYFTDVAFFKPTGDGLLLIHELPHKAAEVPPIVSSILARCVSLVDDFGDLTAEDFMVNFSVPQHLGVGVARGSATRLVSNGQLLDYTGRCLNLAARLMDKARPYGVVFADSHASRLMDDETAANFSADRVCIRGIAEDEPIQISITHSVKIRLEDREPLKRSTHHWGDAHTLSLEQVREESYYGFYLPRRPQSYEVAMVLVEHPAFDKKGKRTGDIYTFEVEGAIEEKPQGAMIYIQMKQVAKRLAETPATTTSKFLEITRKTKIDFTPFCRPK
jgi:class 3 adenylate cyclase